MNSESKVQVLVVHEISKNVSHTKKVLWLFF